MLKKFFRQLSHFLDNHSATKGRPKVFQFTVLLIVIIIIVFIVARVKEWSILND